MNSPDRSDIERAVQTHLRGLCEGATGKAASGVTP